ADPGASQVGKPAFAQAGRSAAYGSVGKVRGRHHAKASVIQLVQVIEIAFQRLRAFGAKEPCDSAGVAIGEKILQVSPGFQNSQTSCRSTGKLLQQPGLVKCPLFGTVPGAKGPAFEDRNVAHQIG